MRPRLLPILQRKPPDDMADADLSAKISTTSDIPEAMDKAKSATVSFAKQTEDIQKKFSTAFKDIFLGFLAPMVLIQHVLGMISDAIAKAKQDTQDILDFSKKGTSVFADKQAGEMARAAETMAGTSKENKMSKKQRSVAAQAFMDAGDDGTIFGDNEANRALQQFLDEGAGKSFAERMRRKVKHMSMMLGTTNIAEDPEMQDVLGRRAALYNARKAAFSDNPNAAPTARPYTAPQGVNAVVGMGNNAAVQAQLDQLEESRKQTVLLEQIATSGGNTPPDFTKPTQNISPSRSSYLKK